MFVLSHKEMMVQVEFQSLIGGVNCVNGGAAPQKKTSEDLGSNYILVCLCHYVALHMYQLMDMVRNRMCA